VRRPWGSRNLNSATPPGAIWPLRRRASGVKELEPCLLTGRRPRQPSAQDGRGAARQELAERDRRLLANHPLKQHSRLHLIRRSAILYHHVIRGKQCSQLSSRNLSRTKRATSPREIWCLRESLEVRERADPTPGRLVVQDRGTNDYPVGRALSKQGPLFLSAYTFRKRSGKIRVSKRRPPWPVLSLAPVPAMQMRRETCSVLIVHLFTLDPSGHGL
jgi:hypothetical protein